VLRALGRSDRLAQSSLRLSLGRFTTGADIDYAAERLREEIGRLRAGRPATRSPATSGHHSDVPPAVGDSRVADASDDPRYSPEVARRVRDMPGATPLGAIARTYAGRAGDVEQGAFVELRFAVNDEHVSEASFSAFGCPHLVAAASWLAERAVGMSRADLAEWEWQSVAAALEVPPAKFGRLLTLQDAARAAVRNWSEATGSTV
jgi:NifU-like protein involved in Fe-S cluster formation